MHPAAYICAVIRIIISVEWVFLDMYESQIFVALKTTCARA